MSALHARRCGVLLHPTSLPGPHGSGDFGPAACHFVDWLVGAGQSVWQVLPLAPIGAGHSPYASASAFAGSPLLVALEPLRERGWLDPAGADEAAIAALARERVDFERVIPFRMARLRQAEAAFRARGAATERAEFDAFAAAESHWLDDYALFMALDARYRVRGVHDWPGWDAALAWRDPAALADAHAVLRNETAFWRFVQWCFFNQWRTLKRYANERGVLIAGDLPIFVAHHSADCWARRDLFQLDTAGQPLVVAGVPPDYFSPTGQRWGNPLYDWAAMRGEGFAWWIERLRHELARADLIRIDHFRGFAACWEIPAASPTAVEGRWVEAPGAELFEALRAALGELPLIAEDLGVITPDVVALRERFALPGMKVLQFAFSGDASHPFLPHNYPANCAVYTGTHDNDTTRGWFDGASDHERALALAYLDCAPADLPWALIRAACASVAQLAVYPMQDVLGLGRAHRMNTPGATGCWTWRFDWSQVESEPARHLAHLAALYGRAPFDRLRASGAA